MWFDKIIDYVVSRKDGLEMIGLLNGKYIIGFDNGYQMSKTATELFDNGVYDIGSSEPSVTANSLYYDGRYYKIGEGRALLTEDKVSDGNARLLTMVAIAREIKNIGMYEADVILAVGLPFKNYGDGKPKLIDYYNKCRHMVFEYEGDAYDINISNVMVFPQCYSAIAPRIRHMIDSDYVVVDIGSKTTDVVFVRNGRAIESRSVTIEKAMVKWIKQIIGDLQAKFGKEIPEDEVMNVILMNDSFLSDEYQYYIRERLKKFMKDLELDLKERDYDLDFKNVIFVGGGATVAQIYGENKKNVAYDTNINANAIGYEFLARQILRKQGEI